MPMGKVKHCLGGCLCLTIAAKHCRKVFHRLQGEDTPTFSQDFEMVYPFILKQEKQNCDKIQSEFK